MDGVFVGSYGHGNPMEEESAWSTTSVIGLNADSWDRVSEIRLRGQRNEELLRRDRNPLPVTKSGRRSMPTMTSRLYESSPSCSSQGSPLFTAMLFMSILSYFIGMFKGANSVGLVGVPSIIESSSLQLLDSDGHSLWSGCVVTAGGIFSLSYPHNEEAELANNHLPGFFWK